MPIVRPDQNSGGGGGGLGTVTSVSSADTSIAVTNPTTTPSLQLATLDVIATNEPPAASVPMNTHKLTGLASGTTNGDSVRYEQVAWRCVKSTGNWTNATPGGVTGSYNAVTAGTLWAAPASLRGGTLSGIALYVGTAQATTTVRLGIYNSDANGIPSSLLVDAGTIDSSTTGFKTITISQAVSDGLFWMVYVQGSGTGASLSSYANDNGNAQMIYSSGHYANASAFAQTGVTGALPDPFGTPAGLSNFTPRILIRYSA